MDILISKDPHNILNPSLKKIGNCVFRYYNESEGNITKNQANVNPYLDNDDDMINCMEFNEDIDIIPTSAGKYIAKFHVADCLFATIIGAKGLKRKEIEMNTDTQVKVPRKGETGDIVITGSSEKNVASAFIRIQMIVLQARDKKQPTHFVSIPVTSVDIRTNFEIFKRAILNGPALRGVDESIFQTPEKLHLTITALVLLDDYEKNEAVNILDNFKSAFRDLFRHSGPLKINLEGLEIMNDDPTNVDVLYGKVKLNYPKYNTPFQKMADQIADEFYKKGLVRRQYESVKLHVTLMNSMFRKRSQECYSRESFDASYILNNYRSFSFGETEFKDVSLVVRHTTAEDKFYERLATITL